MMTSLMTAEAVIRKRKSDLHLLVIFICFPLGCVIISDHHSTVLFIILLWIQDLHKATEHYQDRV